MYIYSGIISLISAETIFGLEETIHFSTRFDKIFSDGARNWAERALTFVSASAIL